uniref:Uncharacterized protein n=1 Tax=Cereibacter sphaeroides (strain ATCC 17025 / ATH 2.4.3) TaxID=349102 RepID=A4WVT2_CERS5
MKILQAMATETSGYPCQINHFSVVQAGLDTLGRKDQNLARKGAVGLLLKRLDQRDSSLNSGSAVQITDTRKIGCSGSRPRGMSSILTHDVRDEYVRDLRTQHGYRHFQQRASQGHELRSFGERTAKPTGVRVVEQNAQHAVAQLWLDRIDVLAGPLRYLEAERQDHHGGYALLLHDRHDELVVQLDVVRLFGGIDGTG